MEEEKEEGGISLGKIFRTIFSQKWLALIIIVVVTVAVTVAGTLWIYYIRNNSTRTYDVSFTFELPRTGKEDDKNTTLKPTTTIVYYPDGTPFYYTDIVSLSSLEAVRNSNEALFKDIEVEKMSNSGDISITRAISETALNSGEYEANYTISVKASYFSGDKDLARDFMVALTNIPIDYLFLMDIDYDVYLETAKVAPDYVSELTRLIHQVNYLIERYDALVEIYSDLSVDGKTLRSYSQDLKSYINDRADLDILRAEARRKCYLKSEELKYKYETELYNINGQLEIAEATLENLLAAKGDTDFAASAAVIKAQSDLVGELQQEKREIIGYYNEATGEEIIGFKNSTDFGENKSEAHKAFLVNLDNAYKQVQSYTDEFQRVITSVYSKVAVVSYTDSNIVITNGVTGIAVSFVISFVAAIVIAMIVAYIVGLIMQKRAAAKLANTKTEQAPALCEVQSHTALNADKTDGMPESESGQDKK